jgi:hypothetical protein
MPILQGGDDRLMTRPDRQGKKSVQGFVTVEQWKKLRHIVTETQRDGSSLISEAIDMLAEKYGIQPKEPSGRKTKPGGAGPS